MTSKAPDRRLAAETPRQRLLRKLALLLVANGESPRDLADDFKAVCAGIPEPAHRSDPGSAAFATDLGHVLTCWYTDPVYLDGRGQPLPLPTRGFGPTIARLVRQVNPGLSVERVVAALLERRSLRHRKSLLVPTGRKVLFADRDQRAAARVVVPLEGLVDTLEYNLNREPDRPARFERSALNPSFPLSSVGALTRKVLARGTEFLHEVDSEMRRSEERARPSDPRTCVGVELFLFEIPPESSRTRNRGAPGPKPRTTRGNKSPRRTASTSGRR